MTIVGQPKTTAQYIQVSGRVGRNAEGSPGLVITIYGASKPRDRSHYERFRTYHQQLYAQVEPTSVTPFASRCSSGRLHAAAISRMRQLSPDARAEPVPAGRVRRGDRAAARACRPSSMPRSCRPSTTGFSERAHEWETRERTDWAATTYFNGDPKQGLMRPAGELPDPDNKASRGIRR